MDYNYTHLNKFLVAEVVKGGKKKKARERLELPPVPRFHLVLPVGMVVIVAVFLVVVYFFQ